MTTSDLIALLALCVALFALGYTRVNAHASIGSNELTFRSEWLEAYDAMRKAQLCLSLPVGAFAKLTDDVKRGYPMPLSEELASKLRVSSARAELWTDDKVHELLKEALVWNEQLGRHLEFQDPEAATSLEAQEEFRRDAATFADSARKSLGLAIEVVAIRLRKSAP